MLKHWNLLFLKDDGPRNLARRAQEDHHRRSKLTKISSVCVRVPVCRVSKQEALQGQVNSQKHTALLLRPCRTLPHPVAPCRTLLHPATCQRCTLHPFHARCSRQAIPEDLSQSHPYMATMSFTKHADSKPPPPSTQKQQGACAGSTLSSKQRLTPRCG